VWYDPEADFLKVTFEITPAFLPVVIAELVPVLREKLGVTVRGEYREGESPSCRGFGGVPQKDSLRVGGWDTT